MKKILLFCLLTILLMSCKKDYTQVLHYSNGETEIIEFKEADDYSASKHAALYYNTITDDAIVKYEVFNDAETDITDLSYSYKTIKQGSEEWKVEEVARIKNDSAKIASLKEINYKNVGTINYTNRQMSDLIDFLSSNKPYWSGYREAFSDFYLSDERASIPMKFITTESENILKIVMPIYRRSFSKNLGESLWEEDIYITTSGKNDDIINVTGAIFATNKNIADMQIMLREDLTHFGFKEVRYRWYKGATDYTPYSL